MRNDRPRKPLTYRDVARIAFTLALIGWALVVFFDIVNEFLSAL